MENNKRKRNIVIGPEMGFRLHNFWHMKVKVKLLIWTNSLDFLCSQWREMDTSRDQFNAHLLEVYFRIELMTLWRCLAIFSA